MNKFLARIGIILISTYIILVIIFAWNGISLAEYKPFLGHSLIVDCILLFMCYDDEKYFCRYMRYQCYNFIFTDLVYYFDTKYHIFDIPEHQLMALTYSWCIAFVITVVLAVKHFRRVRKVRKHRYKEYGVRR